MPTANKRSRTDEDDSSSGKEDRGDNNDAKKSSKSKSEADHKQSEDDGLAVSAGTNPTPIFLKKTYKMIDSCDPEICCWSADGLSFIVKDPDTFAAMVIPQYFDHNKFSSFARQLNFYGFRKIQTKPIKNSDYDETTAKHVTFFNEKFRRGRQDLLREITRSTRSSGNAAAQASQGNAKDLDALRTTVTALEQRVAELETKLIESSNELKGRVDLIVMELTTSRNQQQQAMFQAQMAAASMGAAMPGLLPAQLSSAAVPTAAAAAGPDSSTLGDAAACTLQNVAQNSFGSGDVNNAVLEQKQPMLGVDLVRAFSSASARPAFGQALTGADLVRALSSAGATARAVSGGVRAAPVAAPVAEPASATAPNPAAAASAAPNAAAGADTAPTLPPHPKQKQLPPPPSLPPAQAPPEAQSKEAQALAQAQAAQAQAQATQAAQMQQGGAVGTDAAMAIRNQMIRNAMENNLFDNLMRADGASRAASLAGLAAANPAALGAPLPGGLSAFAAAQQQLGYNPYLQNRMQSMQSLGLNGGILPPGFGAVGRNPSIPGGALDGAGDGAAPK